MVRELEACLKAIYPEGESSYSLFQEKPDSHFTHLVVNGNQHIQVLAGPDVNQGFYSVERRFMQAPHHPEKYAGYIDLHQMLTTHDTFEGRCAYIKERINWAAQ
jgi:hypothetical protein